MLREPRNPFKLRAAEPIVSDSTFLRLFGPRALELVPHDNWDRVQIFQGAPGCGKTSLFRVFTPSALLTLYRYRSDEEYKELYKRMEGLEIVHDSGPDLLGVMLSCEGSYALIEDLGKVDPGQRDRLFYALLNARIILSTLRGACALKHISYPGDLDQLTIEPPLHASIPEWLINRFPCSGKELYKWVAEVEETICAAIDSYDPDLRTNLSGFDTLFSLAVMRAEALLHGGRPVTSRVLIMLDNANKLADTQRRKIFNDLHGERWPVGVWIAERLEALAPRELLARGATVGREYSEPIRLDEYWRDKRAQFLSTVTGIADKRAKFASDFMASDLDFGSFGRNLDNILDQDHWSTKYEDAYQVVVMRLTENFGNDEKYRNLVDAGLHLTGNIREKAVNVRATEIILERESRKAQQPLFPLDSEEIERIDESDIQTSAELFLSREFGIPYYYGMSTLSALASGNIEQFLSLAGELFEQIISARLLGQQLTLSAEKQQSILKKAFKVFWDSIPRRVPEGDQAQKLLYAIQQFAREETYRPNASYAPGVTGIGFTGNELRKLIDVSDPLAYPGYSQLAFILSACISENLLEPVFINQGEKGEKKLVLYLNRWLCCQADLPLQYGGWRPVPVARLQKWLQYGFRSSREDGDSLL